MKIEILSERKSFEDQEPAIKELAFCHYPVTVKIDDLEKTFETFDKAVEFVSNKN